MVELEFLGCKMRRDEAALMVWEVGSGLDAGQVVHGCTGWSGTACALALPRHSPRGTNSCSVAARPTYSPRRSTTTRTAAWIGRSCEICSIVSVGTRAGLSRGSSSTSWSSLCTTRTPTARRRKLCLGKGGNLSLPNPQHRVHRPRRGNSDPLRTVRPRVCGPARRRCLRGGKRREEDEIRPVRKTTAASGALEKRVGSQARGEHGAAGEGIGRCHGSRSVPSFVRACSCHRLGEWLRVEYRKNKVGGG